MTAHAKRISMGDSEGASQVAQETGLITKPVAIFGRPTSE
jgi:hypothetical protein